MRLFYLYSPGDGGGIVLEVVGFSRQPV